MHDLNSLLAQWPDAGQIFSRINQVAGWRVALCFLAVVGCRDEPASRVPETDEAMKRALAEDVTIEQAADYYTYRIQEYDKTSAEAAADDVQSMPDFPASQEQRPVSSVSDYFRGMDAVSVPESASTLPDALLKPNESGEVSRTGVKVIEHALTQSEIIGRNTWMAWCAGNEGFWDWLSTDSLGFIDLLKLVDSRNRSDRFRHAGLINEPGMDRNSQADNWGLWLDHAQDAHIRQWRKEYLEQTFAQLAEGKHKSQIGLRKRGRFGEYDGPWLYSGDPKQYAGERGYQYPASYHQPTQFASEYAVASPRESYDSGHRDIPEAFGQYLDRHIPPPDLYGLSSGVIGLRLFPNPYFDAAAQAKWDGQRYYTDKAYYTDPNLIRPYRVGMSCAFCHASFHPLKPPADENYPQWKNISGNIGAQYLSMRATVGGQLTPDQFVYHLLDSQPRGTIDTSLVASDNINNPNTMNAVFGLRQRAFLSLFNAREHLSKASASLPSLWGDPSADPSANAKDPIPQELREQLAEAGLLEDVAQSNSNPRHVPRILLDGSDSIGTFGALARVYLNIGSYWEQWNKLHNVVLGLTPQRPFSLRDCETNSVYWNATVRRVPGLRDYFLRITPTMPLLSTPQGTQRLASTELTYDANGNLNADSTRYRALRVDATKLQHGRQVFAANCIVCHSSIQPENMSVLLGDQSPAGDFAELIQIRNAVRLGSEESGEFWEHDPAQWIENDKYQEWAAEVVEIPKFWTENYLSTDYRIPINYVNTNAARAMATNGMSGHMWEDFASESYRKLPSPGSISYFNPYAGATGQWDLFQPRHQTPPGAPKGGGGPGYYRVPTLLSIWATAPLLHNNSLGLFNNDPSVDGRLLAFDDAIRKLLWPAKRVESSSYNDATAERLKRDNGLIWRTPCETYLSVDAKRVPYLAGQAPLIQQLHKNKYLRWLTYVEPLWLPSLILLLGAATILLAGKSPYRLIAACVFLTLAILFALSYAVGNYYPNLSISNWIRGLTPWYLVPLILLAVGFLLRLADRGPDSAPSRGLGNGLIVLAIGLAVLYWGLWLLPDLQIVGWLAEITPWQLPLVTLLIVGVVLLLPVSLRWTRYLGYLQIVAALLIGAIVYFTAGQLGDVRIGPIPAGTPVNLLANFNPEASRGAQLSAIRTVTAGLAEIQSRHLDAQATEQVMREKIAPALMQVNKCPDFVMDRGHYFPWFHQMTDEDKHALIELLKTL